MTTLFQKSSTQLRQGLLRSEFSVREVVDAFLQRCLAHNESLNSFVSLAGEELSEDIEAAQRLLKEQGEHAPKLVGIPIAVKDCIATESMRTTCGSKMLADYRSPFSATVVRKLKQAGAIIVGKTNLDEFAMGSSSEYSYFGPVKNPWALERVAGGTSGGSAAAVSAAQVPLALGSDTGGSIRQPAAFCGVFGLKPTYGRVSRYGLVAHASSFDQIGTLARSVDDLAASLEIIAGPDAQDASCSGRDVPSYSEELDRFANGFEGLRLGVPKEYFGDGIQSEVAKAVEESIRAAERKGAVIKEVSLPHTKYALATYYIITPAEASSNLARYDGVHYGYRSPDARTLREVYEKSRSEAFGPEVKRRVLIGSFVLSAGYYDAYYRKAQQVRTLLIDDFKAAFANHCDLLIAPTSPTTAFRIGERDRSPLEMYRADIFTVPASIAGLPAVSLPCGSDQAGLPIGLQLIGPAFSEGLLLAAAAGLSTTELAEIPEPFCTEQRQG